MAADGALRPDECSEIFHSSLGVFIKFHSLKFGWASRLVHHMLSLQLDTLKPYEIWSLIGAVAIRFSLHEFEHLTGLNYEYVANLETPEVEVTDEMKAFWELLGVDLEMGPSVNDLVAACGACQDWSRVDRMWLGYLCIFAGYIEGRRDSTPTSVKLARLIMDLDAFVNYPWGRVAFKNLFKSVKEKDLTKSSYVIEGFVQVLQLWVYWALPDFGKEFGDPLPYSPTPLLLAFKESRFRKNFKENLMKQNNVKNFVMKNTLGEMYLFWDDDVVDAKVDNILKVSFNKAWKWKSRHWPVVGVNIYKNPNKGSGLVKSEPSYVKPESPYVKADNLSLHIDGQSRKRPRSVDEDPVSLVLKLQSHFDDCFTGLRTTIMDGFTRCEKRIKGLADKVAAMEKSMLNGGGKVAMQDGEEKEKEQVHE